ncbi:MAG TPA: BlaI/MecI/CopY family transcriptional regulator [Micromonosporaceae bacterium]
MTPTGALERAVLETLWSSPDALTAKDVVTALSERDLAVTTVLTVLDRLGRKGLVSRERDGRAHRYRAAITREDYIADLMLEALGQAPDRDAALTRFLGGVSASEADHLRRELRRKP